MRRSLFLLMLLLSAPAMAQTFYEVNYTDPDDGEEYTGLMIYFDDEHCKMRLITEESLAQDKVFESNYTQRSEGKTSADDVGVMAYMPDEEGFPTFLWVWERDDASDVNEEPYCTYDVEDEDSYFEVEYFREITLRDMDQEYIEQFYSEGEREYRLLMRGIRSVRNISDASSANELFSSLIASANANSSASTNISNNVSSSASTSVSTLTDITASDSPAPTYTPTSTGVPSFHLLLIANTEVSDIGTACRRDMSNVRSEFGAIAKVLGMNYVEHLVSESQYNKAYAVSQIRGIEVEDNDVLMFVYTGHGFRFDDQSDYYPNIDLCATSYDDIRKNYASMTDIYNELASKGARLTIVLSDCCNSRIGLEAPMINVNSLYARANNNFELDKLRTLFLESSGSVRATSSSPGEASWCGVNGGFFLLSFIESLRTQISPLHEQSPSWDRLMSDAIASAKSKSLNTSKGIAQNGLQTVKMTSLSPAASPEQNTAPGTGGNTLDL